MKQTSYTISAAQNKLRAIAGDHFIALPIKVKKSDVTASLDVNEVLKAGTLITKDGKTITTTTGTPATTNAYGVVYEDVNQNNIQDDNETGIAGVRLFTVTGNQVQTDGNGRFNLPIDLSRSQRARKLLIKLDTSSLPPGYTVSTENPLLIHNGFSTPVSVNFAIIKK